MSNVQLTKQHKNAPTDKLNVNPPTHPQRSYPDFLRARSCLLTPSPGRLQAISKSVEEVKVSVHPTPQGDTSL